MMKKIAAILSLLISGTVINAQSFQLPNSDFEDVLTVDTTWSDGPPLSYDSLDGGVWGNANVLMPDFPSTEDLKPFMKDTSFAYSGNHAALMRTQLVGPAVATGNLWTGFLDPQQLDLNAPLFGAKTGVPFPYRPITFNGFYYYTSVNQDSCWMACLLTKWNSNTQQRDTVGFGEFFGYSSTTNYEPFSVTVNYNTPANILPDSVSLMLLSSGGGLDYQGQPGSTLILDSLWFEQPADASAPENDLSEVANTYSKNGVLTIQFNQDNYRGDIEIYDLSGKLIITSPINNKLVINIPLKPENIYLIKIQFNSKTYIKKVFINH